jgi:hypothetical protein
MFLGLCLLISSCKKDTASSTSQTAGTTSFLSSIRNYSPQTLVIDSLTYDTTHRLAVFSEYEYDTTSGSPEVDSIIVVFSFKPNTTVPNSYTYNDIPEGTINDIHTLSYDGNNRIIKDTSLSGSGFVTYYSYPNNNIASTLLFDGTVQNNQIDTLYISNGNITMANTYYPNIEGTADSLEGGLQLGYSSYANPTYNSTIT